MSLTGGQHLGARGHGRAGRRDALLPGRLAAAWRAGAGAGEGEAGGDSSGWETVSDDDDDDAKGGGAAKVADKESIEGGGDDIDLFDDIEVA